MAYPWFSIISLVMVAVLAFVAVAASLVVWRIRSLGMAYRGGLIALIAAIAVAGIGWIVFVSPVYVD
jgi:hypothetical protein